MYRKDDLEERYLNDNEFYKVVSLLESLIKTHGFTPSELRQAVFLAHYKYEMSNPRALIEREQGSFYTVYGKGDL